MIRIACHSLLMMIVLAALAPVQGAQRGFIVVPVLEDNVTKNITLYQRSYALIIGIDQYSAGWPPLSGAVNDAKAVASELEARGFEVSLELNSKSNRLKQLIEAFIYDKGQHKDARLFIWFAGHGHTINGEGYLVPADAPSPDKGAKFRRKALSLRRFGEFMREAESKHVLTVFDSCFSGTVFSAARALPPSAITLATTRKVRQFISSGEAKQAVSDNGLFRKLFLDAITGVDNRADMNADGYILGSELGLFLHQEVTNLTTNQQTPRYGKLRARGLDRGDFVFKTGKSNPSAQAAAKPQQATAPPGQMDVFEKMRKRLALLEFQMKQQRMNKAAVRNKPAELKTAKVRPDNPIAATSKTTRAARKPGQPFADRPGSIGVRIQPLNKANREELGLGEDVTGVIIQSTVPGGPADKAQMKVGDVITGVDGSVVTGNMDMVLKLARHPVGDSVKLDIFRGGKKQQFQVRLGASAVMIFNIGRVYYQGLGNIEKNYPKALEYYLRAANNGSSAAMNMVGWMMQKGLGVAINIPKAAAWYGNAAKKGHGPAMAHLADLYTAGTGIAQDHVKAANLYLKAAEKGQVSAMYKTGRAYQAGTGVGKAPAKAAEWFRKASDKNHPRAMFALGNAYSTGNGVPRDNRLAAHYIFNAVQKSTDANRGLMGQHIATISLIWAKPLLREFQRLMKEAGYYSGRIDGRHGPGTARAIKSLTAGEK